MKKKTYASLISAPLDQSLYESYTISDYIIYIAFLNDYTDFIKYITGQKIIFPQTALYLSIIKMDKSLCDLCFSYGCKLDSNCVTLACMIFDFDMIKQCVDSGINPTENDIGLIFHVPNGGHNNTPLENKKNLNLKYFTDSCIKYFGYLHRFHEYENTNKLIFNQFYAQYFKPDDENSTISISISKQIKIKKLKISAKEKCINYLFEKKIAEDKIIQLCANNNMKISEKFFDNNNATKYYESLCQKYNFTAADAKKTIKELKLMIDKKEPFTKKMANYVCKNGGQTLIKGLITIDEITKDKDIMEIFLNNDENEEITVAILNIKHNYNEKILSKLLDKYCNTYYKCNIVKILIENYNVKITKEHINNIKSQVPLLKYLCESNKIEMLPI